MVTQPILKKRNYFKRTVIWESFDTYKSLIAPPGEPCGCFENGISLGRAFCAVTLSCAGQTASGCQKST